MKSRMFAGMNRCAAGLGTAMALVLTGPCVVRAQVPTCTETVADYATFTTCTGTLTDGAPYAIQIPSDWNGTLILNSHGYIPPGTSVGSPINFIDPLTRQWLLQNGYAFAGSFSGTGYVVREALHDQIETLDMFASLFGTPTRAIARGSSMGGLVSAGLIQQHPGRFAGALSTSGVLAGGVGILNQWLDFAFAVQQLLGPESGLEVVHITNPGTQTSGNLGIAQQLLAAAQNTPAGRARIALACALADVPGWFGPTTAEPAPDAYAAKELSQFQWATRAVAPFAFAFRAEIEARAGGNPSWNTGVNYKQQLEKSVDYAEVQGLYTEAGLSLDDDLATLDAAARIDADPGAVEFVTENIVFDGNLGEVPVLTLHTTGDGLSVSQNEQAYRSVVRHAKDSQLLRQAFIHRAGMGLQHSQITPAEEIAALQALAHRIDAGKWVDSADPCVLNAAATALGSLFNVLLLPNGTKPPTPPAYLSFDPAPFLRPFDLSGTSTVARFAKPVLDGPVPRSAEETSLGRTQLLAAWPVPYRGGSLQVSFRGGASAGASADVAIYDVTGRRVCKLTRAGRVRYQSLEWDGRDATGVEVSSGIYFLRAIGAAQDAQAKIVVIR